MVWKINESIKLHPDHWPILEVDCFTKPHALIIDSLALGLYETYLYYVALSKSYGFSHELSEGEEWSFGVHSYVARNLGFNYQFYHCATIEEFRELVQGKINMGIPLLIPGNLKVLYYTWAYRSTDTLHMFLVKGYERELGLYSIQDNMHLMTQPIPNVVDESETFANFLIPIETLEEAWDALHNLPSSYYLGKVVTLEPPQRFVAVPTPEEKLQCFADYLTMERLPMRYRELSVLQFALQFFQETGEPVDGRERKFRFEIIFANKKAVLTMILMLLREVAKDEDITKATIQIGVILDGWARFKRTFYLHLMRGSIQEISDLEQIYYPILDTEEELMGLVGKVLTKE